MNSAVRCYSKCISNRTKSVGA
ncbi:hypothetical protein OF001_U10499 [Pseudomonas sp. OF001]|nr:hypothetical protein OF001_U10499 [Pseudomonas sp. OF001]